mmetsp:Transcript_15072/g.36187  ORF Transcript_15072/g.36187 Transcript_15072/m.36187 type:complete len:80 (+) Transcript_15072:450-689(+)
MRYRKFVGPILFNIHILPNWSSSLPNRLKRMEGRIYLHRTLDNSLKGEQNCRLFRASSIFVISPPPRQNRPPSPYSTSR